MPRAVRYEKDVTGKRRAGVFADGNRIPVSASRMRAYPALPGLATDTAPIYQVIADRLGPSPRRVADLGSGAGAGTAVMASAGHTAVGIESHADAVRFARSFAAEATFECSSIEDASLSAYDALVMVDVLGLTSDDAALLRAVAEHATPSVRLLAAVARADIEQRLEAPARRAYSRESLDVLLVRGGWRGAVVIAQTAEMLVFEASRAETFNTADALEAARRAVGGDQIERAIDLVAKTARQTEDASDARALLLALGELHLAAGSASLAEQAATAANAIAPECADPYVLLARVSLRAGEAVDAEALYDHALGLDASNHAAWRGLGSLCAARGETARAAEALEFAAALAPDDVRLARELAGLYAAMSSADGAARALERPLAYGDVAATMHASCGWLSIGVPPTNAPVSRPGRRGESTGSFPVVAGARGDEETRRGRSLAS